MIPPPAAERRAILLLTLIQFVHTLDFVILMPLGPRFMRAFEIGPREFSWMVSAYAIAASAMGLLSSLFIDRFDRKRSLLFLFAGFAVGTAFCALAPDHRYFILARALTGAFGGVLGANVLSIVGDLVPAERRGAATGQVLSAFAIASVIGIPIGVALANAWDWHAPFLLLASLCAVLWVACALLLPPVRGHLERALREARERGFIDRLRESFFGPGVAYALLFSMLLVFSAFVVIPMLSAAMVANGGIAESDLPWVYLFGGGITFFSSRWVGRLSDLHGKVRIFRLMALFSLAPLLVLTRMPTWPLAALIALTALFMFSMNGRYVPAMALFTGVVPPERRGNFLNVLASLQQLALSAGALVAGGLVTKSETTGRLEGYPATGWISAGIVLLCVAGAGRIRSSAETLQKSA